MISRSWRVWDLERIERELRVSSCHPERSEGSARWRVQKLFWSRARDARAPAPRGERSRSMRAALATPYRHEASGASFPRRYAPRDDNRSLSASCPLVYNLVRVQTVDAGLETELSPPPGEIPGRKKSPARCYVPGF